MFRGRTYVRLSAYTYDLTPAYLRPRFACEVARPNKIVQPKRSGDYVVNVTIRMVKSVHRQLQEEGLRRDLSISDLIAEAFSMRTVTPIYPDTNEEAEMRDRARR